MKKRLLAILVCIAFVAVALFTTAVWAQKTKSGVVADTLKIFETGVFKKHKKPPVTFGHKKHSVDYKIACTECHHRYKDGKQIWKEGDKVATCGTCHTSAKKNDGKMLSLYNAFHKNCRTCHKKGKKGKKGPTKCSQCHAKKK